MGPDPGVTTVVKGSCTTPRAQTASIYHGRVQIEPPGKLVHRRGRGADAARARADGGRQRAGVPAAGTPVRGRARLLRDGLLRRDRASQREDARLPPRRLRRASAGDPDLRLQPRHDGRGGADGRGGRRRHRRHQLRLPGAQGDEDGRRSDAARRPRARLPHRRRGRRRRRPAGVGEDAPRPARRLTRLPHRRAASRRGRRLGAHPAPPLGAADVHRHGGSQPDRRARLARRRAGDRLGRHHVARACPGRPRDDGRGRGDGRPRRAGQPVGAAGDRRRRRDRADPRGGRRRARALHPRDGARARRAARLRLPEEVLRAGISGADASRGRSSRSSSCSTRPRRSSDG